MNARFSAQAGLAVDPAGNILVADSGNARVRKISPAGTITSIAGTGPHPFAPAGDNGPAVSAGFFWPASVASDAAGNVFVADEAYGSVRKISPDGLVTTVFEGSRSPALGGYPPAISITLDREGNLFVSDMNHHLIRKVSAGGGVSVAAGTGAAEFSGDGGPATRAGISKPCGLVADQSGNLYFIDSGNRRVRKVAGDGTITTVAGGGNVFPGDRVRATEAELFRPVALAIDADDNLYFSAGWIQKVSRDGEITIVAGNGTYSFAGNGEPAISAQLWGASDVAIGPDGKVFIVDSNNQLVRSVDARGIISTVAGSGELGYSGDGGPAIHARLGYPSGAAVDSNGNLFIADGRNNRIRKVSPSGTITTFAGNGLPGSSGDNGPATKANLNYPLAVATDKRGNLFIADYQGHRIRKVSKEGMMTTVAGTGEQGFSGDGGPATEARLFIPRDVQLDDEGNVYIVDAGNSRVRKVTPDGRISTIAGNGTYADPENGARATESGLFSPQGAAVDTRGNVLISTAVGGIYRLSGDGVIRTVVPPAPASYTYEVSGDGIPAGMAVLGYGSKLKVSADGRIYVAAGNSVRVLEPVERSIVIAAVVDAASQRSIPISPGKIVILYGVGMGPSGLLKSQPSGGVYPAGAGGTSVMFNGIAAPVLYSSEKQVAAVVPYGLEPGSGSVAVSFGGVKSDTFEVDIAAAAPSLFSRNGTGAGQALAVSGSGSLNDAANPAHTGEYLSLYATGEGRMLTPVKDGQVTAIEPPYPRPLLPVSVTVGGQPATVVYAGAAPGEVAGLMQVVIQIPEGAPPGGYVPITLRVGEASTVEGAAWISIADRAGRKANRRDR